MAHLVDSLDSKIRIALVGKYCGLQDSYLSVIKALKHAAVEVERDLEIVWIEAGHLEDLKVSLLPSSTRARQCIYMYARR